MTEGKRNLELAHAGCRLLHFQDMKDGVSRTRASYFYQDLPRPRLWNRHFTEFARLLKLNKLERFLGYPSVADTVDVDQDMERAAE